MILLCISDVLIIVIIFHFSNIFLKNKYEKKQGFTLIELIVVIAIVGLVATVTLASLGAARQRGADASKIRAVAEIRSALGIYFSENGKFPTGNVTTGVADLTTALVVPKYISSIDTNIKYQSINTTNTVCTTNCQ